MRPTAPAAAALGAAAAVAWISGCSDDPGGGPLQDVAERSETWVVCVPAEPGDRVTFGVLTLTSPTAEEMVLEDLAMGIAEGMSLIEARVGDAGLELAATDDRYPPAVDPDVWAQTRPLKGATVGAAPRLVTLGFEVDARPARAAETTLTYSLGGERHEAVVVGEYEVNERC